MLSVSEFATAVNRNAGFDPLGFVKPAHRELLAVHPTPQATLRTVSGLFSAFAWKGRTFFVLDVVLATADPALVENMTNIVQRFDALLSNASAAFTSLGDLQDIQQSPQCIEAFAIANPRPFFAI